jgi:hypothetical protein
MLELRPVVEKRRELEQARRRELEMYQRRLELEGAEEGAEEGGESWVQDVSGLEAEAVTEAEAGERHEMIDHEGQVVFGDEVVVGPSGSAHDLASQGQGVIEGVIEGEEGGHSHRSLQNAPPTFKPSAKPSAKPTVKPTAKPTAKLTFKPTPKPTAVPTVVPTAVPTAVPSALPTARPFTTPSAANLLAPAPATPLLKYNGGKVGSMGRMGR